MNQAPAQAIAKDTRDLEQIVQNSQDILFSADTVFPFTLFPDTVQVDRVKVTINRRIFFGVAKVMSIQTEDILNAEANTGPLFGSLRLWTRFFTEHPLKVNYLKSEDALALKRVLQGFIIARHKGIDCSHIEHQHLVNLLYELGQEGAT